MIIVIGPDATEEQKQAVKDKIIELDYTPHEIVGVERQVIGAVGADHGKDHLMEVLESMAGVESVIPILKPYKLAGREIKSANSVVDCGGVTVGGTRIAVMAGPCSVESREQICTTAEAVKKAGANMMRGGAYKPRTSPYSFQGLGEEGLKYLAEVKKKTGLPVITELMDLRDLEMIERHADIVQIGARNMQNYSLLDEVGMTDKPVMVKRGMSASYADWLLAAEYVMAKGNHQVILTERGIRTFETFTRNTFDLSAIPAVRSMSHLPIVADPSHSTGRYFMVTPMSMAATAAGADVALTWAKQRADEFPSTLVVYSQKPITWRPASGTAYTVGDTIEEAITVALADSANHAGSPLLVSGLNSGVKYRFATFPFDAANNYSIGAYDAVTLREGQPLPIGKFSIPLQAGLNFISLPVDLGVPYGVAQLAAEAGATMVLRYDAVAQKFVAYIPDVPGDEFIIEGGQGYIVNAREAKAISFEGTVWDNSAAAPPVVATSVASVWPSLS
ncbi:MAG: 3-deoxy-7-phosphoheptulonate synthase, partial [Nitrospinae bacterium]|nr:3-deoxy-7-phosphoheptulonate synthase [Nitrospinota bacterium]